MVFGLIMHQGCAFDTDFGILAEVAVRIRAVCARCCKTCSVPGEAMSASLQAVSAEFVQPWAC